LGEPLQGALRLIPLVATMQAFLGIATLLLLVPVPLAVAHQAGAILLFSVVLRALHLAQADRV